MKPPAAWKEWLVACVNKRKSRLRPEAGAHHSRRTSPAASASAQPEPPRSEELLAFLESIPGGSLLIYARAFELAGLLDGRALGNLTDSDLDLASRRGHTPILACHRERLLAASAAYAQGGLAALAALRRSPVDTNQQQNVGREASPLQHGPVTLTPRLQSCPSGGEWGTWGTSSGGTRTAPGTSGAPTPQPLSARLATPPMSTAAADEGVAEPGVAGPMPQLRALRTACVATSTGGLAPAGTHAEPVPELQPFAEAGSSSPVATPTGRRGTLRILSDVAAPARESDTQSGGPAFFGLDDARASVSWAAFASSQGRGQAAGAPPRSGLAGALAGAQRSTGGAGPLAGVPEAGRLEMSPLMTGGGARRRLSGGGGGGSSGGGAARAPAVRTSGGGVAPPRRNSYSPQPIIPQQRQQQHHYQQQQQQSHQQQQPQQHHVGPSPQALAAVAGANEEVHASPLRAALAAGARARRPAGAAAAAGAAGPRTPPSALGRGVGHPSAAHQSPAWGTGATARPSSADRGTPPPGRASRGSSGGLRSSGGGGSAAGQQAHRQASLDHPLPRDRRATVSPAGTASGGGAGFKAGGPRAVGRSITSPQPVWR